MPAAEAPLAAHRLDSILVQFEPGASADAHAHVLELVGGHAADVISDQPGVGSLVRLELGNGVSVEKALEILSHRPGVSFAEPDFEVASQVLSNDPNVTGGQTWGLYGDLTSPSNVYGSQAAEAWGGGYTGSTKVAVGVIDSGVDYTHPDLYQNIWLNQGEIPTAFKSALADTDGDGLITFRDLNNSRNASYVTDKNGNGRIDAGDLLNDTRWEDGVDQDGNGYKDDLIGWDFVNNDNDPMDDQGHGTHVSGTIAASGGNGIGVAGVTWSTQIVALKFLDNTGYGYTSNAIKATDYFTNASVPAAAKGQDFVATNNSWGGAGFSQGLLDAVVRGANKQILFVAAAANGGSDSIGDNNDTSPNYPSNLSTKAAAGYEAVISVAAITSTGGLASYSNYGSTTVDLGAPGTSIYSTKLGGGYGSMSGTSMATPHVTGAIALYSAAAGAGVSAAQIRADLLSSTTATASLNGKVASDGRLDVATLLGKLGANLVPTGIIGTGADDVITTTSTVSGETTTSSGADTVQGLDGNDTLDGGGGNDQLVAGAGADDIIGGSGADTVLGDDGNDTLNGGAGADRLDGGGGSDTYYVDDTGDVVVESASGSTGGGADKVITSLSYTLGTNVERLTLSGTADVSGTGNSLNNVLYGNTGDNKLTGLGGDDVISGGSGDDTVNGGAGVDLLTGGAGLDTFVFAKGQAAGDTIKDFAAGDHVELTGYSAGSTLTHVSGSTTDWLITDKSTGATEVIHLSNGYSLTAADFVFV
jgi:subtilisin family serine protease